MQQAFWLLLLWASLILIALWLQGMTSCWTIVSLALVFVFLVWCFVTGEIISCQTFNLERLSFDSLINLCKIFALLDQQSKLKLR